MQLTKLNLSMMTIQSQVIDYLHGLRIAAGKRDIRRVVGLHDVFCWAAKYKL